MRIFEKRMSAAAVAFALVATASTAFAAPIGKMTALQTSISRGGAQLGVGSDISLGDRLRSNQTGLGVIVFDDQSTAKIGPNSRLTIDEFVYDAKRKRGQANIRMDRGTTRFYGGRISKRDKMTVSTPHVILGVRGGIVDVVVKNGQTLGILRAGRLTCSSGGKTKVVTKPGYACISNGGAPQTLRAGADADILDSSRQIAGTNIPGNKGPGLEVRSDCLKKGAHLRRDCKSRNGSRPGVTPEGGTGIGRPPRVGSDNFPTAAFPTGNR